MCFGKLPQHLLDEYCFYTAKIQDTYDTLLEPLKKSLKNSLNKYLKTRDPASAASVKIMRSAQVAIHPCLIKEIDEKEEALMDFKQQLTQFKPKQTVLETNIVKSNDSEKIKAFRKILDIQNVKKNESSER